MEIQHVQIILLHVIIFARTVFSSRVREQYCSRVYFWTDHPVAIHINGIYDVEHYDATGYPVYLHECGLIRLHHVTSGLEEFWVIGMNVGQAIGFAVTYQRHLMVDGLNTKWYMWDEWTETVWAQKIGSYLICEDMLCQTVVIFGEVPEQVRGEFHWTGLMSYGRAVYRHKQRGMVIQLEWEVGSGCPRWVVKSDSGRVTMKSLQTASSPLQMHAHWYILDIDAFYLQKNVKITCLDFVPELASRAPTYTSQASAAAALSGTASSTTTPSTTAPLTTTPLTTTPSTTTPSTTTPSTTAPLTTTPLTTTPSTTTPSTTTPSTTTPLTTTPSITTPSTTTPLTTTQSTTTQSTTTQLTTTPLTTTPLTTTPLTTTQSTTTQLTTTPSTPTPSTPTPSTPTPLTTTPSTNTQSIPTPLTTTKSTPTPLTTTPSTTTQSTATPSTTTQSTTTPPNTIPLTTTPSTTTPLSSTILTTTTQITTTQTTTSQTTTAPLTTAPLTTTSSTTTPSTTTPTVSLDLELSTSSILSTDLASSTSSTDLTVSTLSTLSKSSTSDSFAKSILTSPTASAPTSKASTELSESSASSTSPATSSPPPPATSSVKSQLMTLLVESSTNTKSPVSQSVTSMPSESAPVSQSVTSMSSQSAPVSQSVTSMSSQSVPVSQSVTSMSSGSAPVSQSVTSMSSGSAPVSQSVTSMSSQSAYNGKPGRTSRLPAVLTFTTEPSYIPDSELSTPGGVGLPAQDIVYPPWDDTVQELDNSLVKRTMTSSTESDIQISASPLPNQISDEFSSQMFTDMTTVKDTGSTLQYSNTECGRRSVTRHHRKKRMTGGSDAPYRGKWPWMVSILHEQDILKCGATLLASQWIVTAAHCVLQNRPLTNYTIVLGAHDLSDDGEVDRQVARIDKVFIPESYKGPGVDDIALVKMDHGVQYSDYIYPACLPEGSTRLRHYASTCYVLGWGARSYAAGSVGGILQEQITKLYTIDECLYLYPLFALYRNTSNFCAIHVNNTISCKGDSGGPIVCEKEGRWVVVGVSSLSTICLQITFPALFTQVSKFVDWIQEKIKENTP